MTNFQGGGHSAAGYSLNKGGIVVDMQYFDKVSIDLGNNSIIIGAGMRWINVYKYDQTDFPDANILCKGLEWHRF